MKFQKIICSLSITVLLGIFCSTSIPTYAVENTMLLQEPPESKIVSAYSSIYNLPKISTMQVLPETIVKVLSVADSTTAVTETALLQKNYPTYSEEDLTHVTIDKNQALIATQALGYKTKLADGVIDFSSLKEEISNERPVIAILTCNESYWIEQETAVVIYGYQIFKSQPLPDGTYGDVTVYLSYSLNHTNPEIDNITGLNNITLLRYDVETDNLQRTYSWSDTLYGFYK